jgi:glycosyltransferase involved in cell wall biosynthesis
VQKLLNEAEIVIAGSCTFPFEMLKERLNNNKLTFWFSERLFKRGFLERFYPPKIKRVVSQCTKYKDKNFYLLCAGGYVAKDYAVYHAFKGKAFTWGYFPPFYEQNLDALSAQKNEKLKILWAGRYLPWKHPEYAIYAAELLKNHGIDFELTMLGNGQLYNKISNLIKDNNLDDCVKQVGAVPFTIVREYMNKSHIFLFTSNRKEGWGAVLNESMNSGCTVIANRKIGSVKSVLINGENGFVYGNKEEFKKIILGIASNFNSINEVGKNAYNSIANIWTGQRAAERFYKVAMQMLNNEPIENYEYGPMTKI